MVKQLLNESQNAISLKFRAYWLGYDAFWRIWRAVIGFADALIPGPPE
jgi:hypothetical protein